MFCQQCGPAVPITCQNVFRMSEIIDKTKDLDCIWGCYCEKGYLRNNDNGQCIPESDCRNSRTNKNIHTSRQLLGVHPVKHLFRPPFASNFGICFGFNCGGGYSSRPPNIAIHNHNVADTGGRQF